MMAEMLLIVKAGTLIQSFVVNQRKKDALTITRTNFDVDGTGGTIAIEVKHNIDFTVENQNAWITPTQTKGLNSALFQYQVEPNMRAFARSGVVVIRSGERSEAVMIRQAAYIPKKVIDVPAEGGTIQVTPTDLSYSSKSEYKIYKTSPWIRQTLEDHSAVLPDKTWQLTVDKNELAESRTGEIVFSIFSPSHLDTIIVRQAASGETPTLLVSQSRYQVTAAGEMISLEVKHNVDVTMEALPEYASWILAPTTKALQATTRSFTIAANITDQIREGKIVVKDLDGNLSDTVYITQSGSAGSADITDAFVDLSFRTIVLQKYDQNKDGKIQASEVANILTLDIVEDEIPQIVSLNGIEQFTALQKLTYSASNNVSQLSLQELDVSRNTRLKSLALSWHLITHLDVSENLALDSLTMYGNQALRTLIPGSSITYLDCRYLKNCTTWDLYGPKLKTLKIESCPALRNIKLYCPDLLHFECFNNDALVAVDIATASKLRKLFLRNRNLTSLNLSNQKSLETLSCMEYKGAVIDISQNLQLESISCDNSFNLTNLKINNSTKTALKFLRCPNCPLLTSLDISQCPSLQSLNALYCSKLTNVYTFRKYSNFPYDPYLFRPRECLIERWTFFSLHN